MTSAMASPHPTCEPVAMHSCCGEQYCIEWEFQLPLAGHWVKVPGSPPGTDRSYLLLD